MHVYVYIRAYQGRGFQEHFDSSRKFIFHSIFLKRWDAVYGKMLFSYSDTILASWMPVAVVYIVRHGETDENRTGVMQGHLDTQLNAAGIEQAQMTANALKRVPFAHAYSSDLSRAAEVRRPRD